MLNQIDHVNFAELVLPAQALESFRNSAFDFSRAGGEMIDNSIEAAATVIRILVDSPPDQHCQNISKNTPPTNMVAFTDNGAGIPSTLLAATLQLGTSFHDQSLSSAKLSKFGIGMKLATIRYARRLEIYSRHQENSLYAYSYLDLDEISSGTQTKFSVQMVNRLPSEYQSLFIYPDCHPNRGKVFDSGTLIVWSKIDRLVDKNIDTESVQEKIQKLTQFCAQSYRKNINNGLYLEINNQRVNLYDPLFLIPPTSSIVQPGTSQYTSQCTSKSIAGELINQMSFKVADQDIQILVSLLPIYSSDTVENNPGNNFSNQLENLVFLEEPKTDEPESECMVSVLRNAREIAYGPLSSFFHLYKFNLHDKRNLSTKFDNLIRIEISFPSNLDTYFQIPTLKCRVEPVPKLREKIKQLLEQPISIARQIIHTRLNKLNLL